MNKMKCTSSLVLRGAQIAQRRRRSRVLLLIGTPHTHTFINNINYRSYSMTHFQTTSTTTPSSGTKDDDDVVVEGSTTTHFGFQTVPKSEKESKVRQVFETVADNYDIMNDVMSAGLHRLWKDYLIDLTQISSIAQTIRQQQEEGFEFKILDVAGGTGDISFRFAESAGCVERAKSSGLDPISVTVCDINAEMLRVGKARAQKRYGDAILNSTKALSFVQGNAESLPFDTNTFDLYTIAFGLRNVTNVNKALQDAYRVLKPGGRFMCLEFSKVQPDFLQHLYDAYSFNIIPNMGQVIANDRASYQYLVESIRKFSTQEELKLQMQDAGFQSVKFTNLQAGIVAIHEGYKPLI